MRLEKITKPSRRRRYDDACATAHALDLVGERWALLVVRELMLGPKRFGDLRSGLPGISANVLTQRLDGLEAVGVVARRRLPPPAAVHVYELTPWGYESEPIFQALGRWAARSPSHDPGLPFSAASLMLSMRTMLDGEKASGLDVRIGFVVGVDSYVGHLADGLLQIDRGTTLSADAVLTGPAPVIAAAIYGGESLAALEASGALQIGGDRALVGRFVTLFPLPPKVVPAQPQQAATCGKDHFTSTTEKPLQSDEGGRSIKPRIRSM